MSAYNSSVTAFVSIYYNYCKIRILSDKIYLLGRSLIYSISHRKLRDLAEAAGAVYRINDVTVLLNKEILDDIEFIKNACTVVKTFVNGLALINHTREESELL